MCSTNEVWVWHMIQLASLHWVHLVNVLFRIWRRTSPNLTRLLYFIPLLILGSRADKIWIWRAIHVNIIYIKLLYLLLSWYNLNKYNFYFDIVNHIKSLILVQYYFYIVAIHTIKINVHNYLPIFPWSNMYCRLERVY
jgi:hypothetical protein